MSFPLSSSCVICQPFVHHWPEWYNLFWTLDAEANHLGSPAPSPTPSPWMLMSLEVPKQIWEFLLSLEPAHAASLPSCFCRSRTTEKVRRVTKEFKIFCWHTVSVWAGVICVIWNKCNNSTIYFQLSSRIIEGMMEMFLYFQLLLSIKYLLTFPPLQKEAVYGEAQFLRPLF